MSNERWVLAPVVILLAAGVAYEHWRAQSAITRSSANAQACADVVDQATTHLRMCYADLTAVQQEACEARKALGEPWCTPLPSCMGEATPTITPLPPEIGGD